MSNFKLFTLGCGSAKPSAKHNPSCTVLDIRGTLYMIDCGEGAQQMFQRMRLKFTRLNHIFITHLHGDHCLGLPGLLCSLSLVKCNGTVTVHTFPEGVCLFKEIMNFMGRDLTYDLRFEEIAPTDALLLDTPAISVKSVKLEHRVPAVGYVFEEKPKQRHIIREMIDFHKIPFSKINDIKSGADYVNPEGRVIPNAMLTTPADPSFKYAHISDTMYMPQLAEKIHGADLLLHESTYLEGDGNDAVKRGHSTARQAAMVARAADAKKLILTHFSSRYRDESVYLNEAREVFQNSILNREGLVLEL